MPTNYSSVTAAYLQHLADSDVELLTRGVVDPSADLDRRAFLRGRRGGIEDLLGDPDRYRSVFGSGHDSQPLARFSPFLVFSLAVHHAARSLEHATYVPEWVGVSRRMPLFDVAALREFVSSPWTMYFLSELLASYTHVASGSVLVATRRGMRRQRFSELDPVRLAGLLEVVSDEERPGVLRRMGDLALFLTGVFPDYVARRGFAPIERARLSRASPFARPGELRAGPSGSSPSSGDGAAVRLLQQLGQRCYRAAFESVPKDAMTSNVAVLDRIADRFDDARRVLGLVSESYIFAERDRWFGIGQT